jgi:hypothetical protein
MPSPRSLKAACLFKTDRWVKMRERNVKVYAAIRKPFSTLALMGRGLCVTDRRCLNSLVLQS